MNKYELTIIVKPSLDEEAAKAELESVQELIVRFGGEIVDVKSPGKRRLAYEIAKVTEGYYTFITFTSPTSAPDEIERRIRIKENLLRFLFVRVDA